MSVSPSSRKRKARDLNPHHLLVARISSAARQTVSGYLPFVSGPTGNRTRASVGKWPPRQGGVVPLDHEPLVALEVDLVGVEPTAPILQGSVASSGMQARVVKEVRPGIEPGLPPYHGGVLPKHLQTSYQ